MSFEHTGERSPFCWQPRSHSSDTTELPSISVSRVRRCVGPSSCPQSGILPLGSGVRRKRPEHQHPHGFRVWLLLACSAWVAAGLELNGAWVWVRDYFPRAEKDDKELHLEREGGRAGSGTKERRQGPSYRPRALSSVLRGGAPYGASRRLFLSCLGFHPPCVAELDPPIEVQPPESVSSSLGEAHTAPGEQAPGSR